MLRFYAMFCVLLSTSSFAAINVVVSVDWEGEDLGQHNLNDMMRFRNEFPDIKMLHFLNAAYFTKPWANASDVRQKIASVLRPGDEHGLHIHGWKSLFEAAGVTYRHSPSWDGDKPETNCSYDCGHSVPISVYSVEELRKVIGFSSTMLQQNGFARPASFRAGGWMASWNVLQALVDENFTLDSSALPSRYLSYTSAKYIEDWVGHMWPGVEDITQPYNVRFGLRSILELPDNGCLSDYVTGKQMLATVVKNVELWRQDPSREIYVTIGFHQETAAEYLPRLKKAIQLIKEYAVEHDLPIVFARYPLAL